MKAICPLCGGATALIHEARGRQFVHCPVCDLVAVPPACHLSIDDQRARYTTHHNSIDDAGYVQMLKGPIALLRRCGEEARRVLDYGSGPVPVLVELLRQAGYDATGYDPLFSADADVSRPFDAVVSIETFEHFADPRRELERICRLLRAGGHLVVTTLFHSGPAGIGAWWYARDPTHVAFYSPATFAWIAAAFGFELVCCDNERLALFQRTAMPATPRP